MRHGSIVVSSAGLLEEAVQPEGEEAGAVGRHVRRRGLAENQLALGFEEWIDGASRGPVELVALRVRSEDPGARRRVLNESMMKGLKSGRTEAALVIEVKKDLKGTFETAYWQALAEGVELAKGNSKHDPPVPVRVVLTDTTEWYFFTLVACKPQRQAAPVTVDPGSAAPGSGSTSGAAAAAVPTQVPNPNEAADPRASPGPREFFFSIDGVNLEMRMSELDYVHCRFTAGTGSSRDIVKVMYRLYTALYPGANLEELPERIAEGNRKAREEADAWVRELLADYTQPAQLEAARAARAEAEARAGAEARARAEAEARAEAAARARAQAEARAQQAEAELSRLRALVAAQAQAAGVQAGAKGM
ncbi:hypothetical protein HYH03_010915 [Edaphochlamys debaryana]|uniref:Uncharacterized protein n=1 Tax=Edaphochlamys debaryana TaxID=47281 RepID=A0A836BX38_9CHLO|nr:hypothetical protein HYH03_010915 [Edaphochlamys debaryana]|eukprot:KAG2490764.1 hypothetical protein HYH03_010915 [Edaphochlamys debaryana]